MPFDLVLVRAFQDRPTGKFDANVPDNADRFPIKVHQRVEFPRHSGALDAGVAYQAKVFPVAIIIAGQNPELAGGAERVRGKVHRPPRARNQRRGHRRAAAKRSF